MADRDGVVPAQALAQLVPADGGFAPVEEGGQRHARAGQRRATCWRGAGGKGGGIEWGKEEGRGLFQNKKCSEGIQPIAKVKIGQRNPAHCKIKQTWAEESSPSRNEKRRMNPAHCKMKNLRQRTLNEKNSISASTARARAQTFTRRTRARFDRHCRRPPHSPDRTPPRPLLAVVTHEQRIICF